MDDVVEHFLPTSAGTIRYKVVIILLDILNGSCLYQASLWITAQQLRQFL